jgi:glycosyltransferase involved in cell wall biosynthesis
MNICFYYESIGLGGQQTQTLNLIKQLKMMGHDLSWVYLTGQELEPMVSSWASTYRIPILLGPKAYIHYPWRLLSVGRALHAFCIQQSVQTIISGSGLGSLICGVVARMLGILHFRLVGCSLIQVEQTLYKYYRVIQLDRVVDGYFGWPGVFEELAAKGVPRYKFIKLPPAVDSKMFYPLSDEKRERIRRQLGIASDVLVIGWIGRIAENMQVGNTVDLANLLKQRGFDRFKLLLVGGGPWLNELKKRIQNYGLVENTIITDWVPYEEVNDFMNAMDVIPLLESDPHGGSIMREAMACGRLALSVDGPAGVQKDFMKPDAAILVKSDNFIESAAEEILALAKDRSRIEVLGRNAQAYAQSKMSFATLAEIITNTLQQAVRQ